MTKCGNCGFEFVPDKPVTRPIEAACPCGATVTLHPEPEKPAKAPAKKEADS